LLDIFYPYFCNGLKLSVRSTISGFVIQVKKPNGELFKMVLDFVVSLDDKNRLKPEDLSKLTILQHDLSYDVESNEHRRVIAIIDANHPYMLKRTKRSL